MLRTPRAVIAAFAVALAVAAAGCGGSDENDGGGDSASSDPITIGYLAGTTGFAAPLAESQLAGAQIAVERINAAGGVLGRPLRLSVRDDQSDPEVAVRQARDLVLSDQVRFLAGTQSSAVALAVRKTVADPMRAFYAAPVAVLEVFEDVADGKSRVFGTVYTIRQEAAMVARFIADNPRFRTVAFVGEDYQYAYDFIDLFKKQLAEAAPDVEIVSEDYVPIGASSLAPTISKILSKQPDLVYNQLFGDDLITFLKNANQVDFFDKTTMLASWDSSVTLAVDPKLLPYGQPAFSVYPEPDFFGDDPEVDAVRSEFVARTGERTLTGPAADGYNEIALIAQGIEKARSVDPSEVAAALEGTTVDTLHGESRVRACDHLTEQPMVLGTLAEANGRVPYAHIDGEIVDLSDSYGPDEC